MAELRIAEEWFHTEERNGFLVEEKMKRCWAAEMKTLLVIAEVCERHGLQWYADYGTMLGAARHKGFIPWDDDIDISMPREDYDKLWPILHDELPPYFQAWSRLMHGALALPWGGVNNRKTIDLGMGNAEEEALTEAFFGSPYVYAIDIFPLDFIPTNENEREIQNTWYRSLHETIKLCNQQEDPKELSIVAGMLENTMGVSLPREENALREALWELEPAVATMYSRTESSGMNSLYWSVYRGDALRPFAAYRETIRLPFEMIEVPVPGGYEEILEGIYGDWRTLKKEARGGHDYPYFADQERMRYIVTQAEALDRAGKFDEEKNLLEDGVAEFPDQYAFHYMLARVLQRSDQNRAIACLEEALRLCGDDEKQRAGIRADLESIRKISATGDK